MGSIKVVLLYGSTRNGRFCDTVAGWAAERIWQHGAFAVDPIDPLCVEAAEAARRVEAADAVVVVVPEYNHGYPGSLKSFIDAFYEPWQARPVAFVRYGGASGGLRAVEQLRQVFAELHAPTVRDGVSFVRAWEQFDERGRLREPALAERAMKRLLSQLEWWARSLREARQTRPYAECLA